MSKHTPGPWPTYSEDLRGGKYFTVAIPGIDEPIDIHESDNGEANARLISSAPEMFDAGTRVLDYATLDTILADPKRHDNEVFGIRIGDLRVLAAALSKASAPEQGK